MPIFTIGHSRTEMKSFVSKLKSRGINSVLDLRSKPYSKHVPEYNQKHLKHKLGAENIAYYYVGKELGGMPDDDTYYTNGKLDADKWVRAECFQSGIENLGLVEEKGLCVALLCSEGDPEKCHRFHLVGRELMKRGIDCLHIMPEGIIKKQSELQYGQQLSLF